MYKPLAFIIIFFIVMGSKDQKKPKHDLMFFSMTNEWEGIKKDEPVFDFVIKSLDNKFNTEINHNVRLLSNSKAEPMLFFSDIETSVCADGVCKLANIKVYWNLLGNYVGFGIHPEYPLTKYEHDSFQKADYAKLHQLLLDDNSILKRRKMSELIDQVPVSESYRSSRGVDGVSGATKTEVKESVVKGGLYSCYTLWHTVHGEVKKKIRRYLLHLNSKALTNYFLYSPYNDYQIYALKQLDKTELKIHSQQIVNIFKTANTLTKAYILKKLTRVRLKNQDLSIQYYEEFSAVGINIRTLLIKNLELANPKAVEILSKYIYSMTKNQVKQYLEYLNNSPDRFTKKVKANLKKSQKNKAYVHSFLITEFLKRK